MYEGQSQERKSSIQEQEEELYSREYEDEPIIESLEKRTFKVDSDWDEEGLAKEEQKINSYVKKRRTMVKNILIASLVFFICAMAIAFYVIYGNKNLSSPENINMSVVGPVSVDAGREVDLQVLIENKNPADLLSATLFIDLPEGARATMGEQENVERLVVPLQTIETNALINESFKAIFFGEENKEKKIYVTLEYRFEGSNAVLERKTEHSVLIVSSQVGMTLSMLKEANSGQEIELVISVDSSTSDTLENLMVEMNYPFGFTYTGADPEPMFNDTTWVLDSLEPFESQEIRIRGTIEGEDDNSKVFAADLGAQDTRDPRRLETVYSRIEESIILKKAFIGLQVLIDRKEAVEPVIVTGLDKVYVSIPWQNNLDTKIIDMALEARISHDIVDRASIEMTDSKGFYNSLQDVVIWDQRTNPEFAVVMPGASGVVGFSFEIGSIVSEGMLFKDVEIEVTAAAKGRRLSDVNVPETTKTPAIGKARLLTSFDLISRILFNDGPIQNAGPMPPKANNETTYTVRWQITNGTSKVSNAVVKTTLPPYVSWKGVVSPSSESVAYNEVGGQVVWNVGEVEAGTGVVTAPKEVSFQIGFIPSLTQVGTSPELITETVLTGIDNFTSSVVKDTEYARTTYLTDDNGFMLEEAKVVR
jgi:hypothetical protein